MGLADNLARERVRPQSTLLSDVKAARAPEPEAAEDGGAEPGTGEKLMALPLPGSAYEAAYARPNNKPVPTLRFLTGDAVKGLPYANLDSIDLEPAGKPGVGPVIVMRFAGIVAMEARITGRHLLLLYDLLSYHRIAWVRELPQGRDFRDKDEKATVITGITVEPVKEPA